MKSPHLFLMGACGLLAGAMAFWQAAADRREAAETLAGILGTAGLDGSEGGARIREAFARTESVWGGRITNVTVMPDHVVVQGVRGSRRWYP